MYVKKLFKNFFWKIESRIDIFLIRNGFTRNLIQTNFILNNKGILINSNLVTKNYKSVNINDIIQITLDYFLFLNLFLKKNLKKNLYMVTSLIFLKKKIFVLY